MQKKHDLMTSCRLLKMGEAAEYMGISRITLWRLVKAGRIQTVDIGKKSNRIPENEIVRFSKGGVQ